MFDLHIHTNRSDGVIDIASMMNSDLDDICTVSFCDHEAIFDPKKYITRNKYVKFIPGVEICCNVNGIPIELLGYNYNPENFEICNIVDYIKKLRNDFLNEIIDYEDFVIDEVLPNNVFRMHIKKYFIKKYDSFERGWNKYAQNYVEICHSVNANDVLNAIKAANGVVALAHPMPSFGRNVDDLIDSLRVLHIDAIEMVTPKHSFNDITKIKQISKEFKLMPSVGSDTHSEYKGNLNSFNIDLNDDIFSWIKQL